MERGVAPTRPSAATAGTLCPKDGKRFRIRWHVKKLAAYARAGVGHAWLVDPSLETLEVFRRQGEEWLLVLTAGGNDVVRAEPFEAIELTLMGLWIRSA